jgi:FkbM family methyltransferase
MALISDVRRFLFWVFKKSVKSLVGTRIGQRIPLAGKIFFFVYNHISPRISLAEVQGLKLYLNLRSSIGRTLLMKDSYEKGTTKLFRDLIEEGMVILDIGANIGYYSLFAAKLVGEKGTVFAFEPAPDNFALLVKNIELNGFSNIIPVQKAVSSKTGRGRLFLSSDPVLHSMHQHNGKRSIEVEVTSIDEFIENRNCPVDLIKMDVEGLEMRALEGMLETIKRNPNLKIITEFSPDCLQKSGSPPMEFLKKLMDCGFKLFLIDEQEQTIKLANVDSIMEAYQRGKLLNLYCDRGRERC